MTIQDIHLTPDEEKIIQDFLVLNETIKRLDKDKKRLTESIKDLFEKYKINDSFDYNGSSFTVTESVRKTVNKNKKDSFIQALLQMGKNYLVTTSIDLDTDTIYSEVENGSLDRNFVEQYMSMTPTKTLTCK